MINSLHIINVQSHKNTFLEFHQGVNVIVGTTDSGKSAILRALRKLAFNKPSGTSLKSWWGRDSRIILNDDAFTIKRNIGTNNSYVLNDSEDHLTFKAIGTTVPDEVANALNMTEINLQSQMDSPFLLSKTAGEVASHFNKVAGLDKIDVAQTKVDSWIRSLNGDIISKKKDIEKHTILLEKYAGLEKIEIELEILEELQNQYLGKKNKVKTLSDLMNSIVDTQMEIDQNAPPKYEADVDFLLAKMQEAKELKSDIITLQSLIQESDDVKAETEQAEHVILLESELIDLLQLIETYNTKHKAILELNKALKDISNINLLLEEKEASFKRLSATFKKEMPNVCPFYNVICPLKTKKL